MPNWQPNWDNVRWDDGAADSAVAALRHAADLLDDTAGDRERVANEARAEWRGRYRDEFEERFSGLASHARQLSAQYRDAAAQVVRASQSAQQEQRRREVERARWQMEKEAEELWERLRREAEELARRMGGGR